MAGGEQAAQRIEAMEKRARVVDLRREGLTFTAIGKEMGFTATRAKTLYRQALAAIVSPAVEALRAQQLEELATAREAVMKVLAARHVVVQQGHVVSEITGADKDGKPVYGDPLVDDGPVLEAARTLATLHAREARLVGADAPQRVEATVHEVTERDVELAEMIAEAKARNAAVEAELRGQV